jgi:hypothetical protein
MRGRYREAFGVRGIPALWLRAPTGQPELILARALRVVPFPLTPALSLGRGSGWEWNDPAQTTRHRLESQRAGT